MSQISARRGAHASGHDGHHAGVDMSDANIMPQGFGRGASMILLLLGVVGLVVAGVAWAKVGPAQVLASLHIGAMCALAITLGGLFLVLAMHLTQAGWSVTLRRQLENIASLVPITGAAVVIILATDMALGGKLFAWMNRELVANDVLYQKKAGFLNPVFFMIRAVFYVFVWSALSFVLRRYSTEQDHTGDKWISNRARFTSAWGMLLFALTTAFAGFDWLMSLDYRYFSTMWGVYFFAGAVGAGIATVLLILAGLRAKGKLEGLVTEEHAHDLGKLLFTFTVFWAYIAFSQYFLTWYANIPEETAFFNARKVNGWQYLFLALCLGHFVLPFYFMLWRRVRRSFGFLSFFALWTLVMQIADLYWIVRPQVYAKETHPLHLELLWVDLAGILGVLLIFFGLLLRRVGSGVLIPTRDPRLPEAIAHKNYV
jgi:hypothetical protein